MALRAREFQKGLRTGVYLRRNRIFDVGGSLTIFLYFHPTIPSEEPSIEAPYIPYMFRLPEHRLIIGQCPFG